MALPASPSPIFTPSCFPQRAPSLQPELRADDSESACWSHPPVLTPRGAGEPEAGHVCLYTRRASVLPHTNRCLITCGSTTRPSMCLPLCPPGKFSSFQTSMQGGHQSCLMKVPDPSCTPGTGRIPRVFCTLICLPPDGELPQGWAVLFISLSQQELQQLELY